MQERREAEQSPNATRNWILAVGGIGLLAVVMVGAMRPATDLFVHAPRTHDERLNPPPEGAPGNAASRSTMLAIEVPAEAGDAGTASAVLLIQLHEIAEMIAAGLRNPRFGEAVACQPRASLECRQEYTTALFAVLHSEIFPALEAGRFGMHEVMARGFRVDERTLLHDLANRDADEHVRVAALAMLRFDQPPSPPSTLLAEIPVDASITELALRFDAHNGYAIDSVAAETNAASMASDARHDVRVRGRAILVLGHGATAPLLHETVQRLLTESTLETSLATPLARALGQCGIPCTPTVRLLVRSVEPVLRSIGWAGVARMTSGDRRLILTDPLIREAAQSATDDPGFRRVSTDP